MSTLEWLGSTLNSNLTHALLVTSQPRKMVFERVGVIMVWIRFKPRQTAVLPQVFRLCTRFSWTIVRAPSTIGTSERLSKQCMSLSSSDTYRINQGATYSRSVPSKMSSFKWPCFTTRHKKMWRALYKQSDYKARHCNTSNGENDTLHLSIFHDPNEVGNRAGRSED